MKFLTLYFDSPLRQCADKAAGERRGELWLVVQGQDSQSFSCLACSRQSLRAGGRVVSTWGHSRQAAAQEGGLVLLRTYLPPLPSWSTSSFSITASKLLAASLLSPTSSCCLGKPALVTSLLHVCPQVQLCYLQDAAAPLSIQRGGKLTWLQSYLNLQSRHR